MHATETEAMFDEWLVLVSECADFLVVRDRWRDFWIIAEDDRGDYYASHMPSEDYPLPVYRVDVGGCWLTAHAPLTPIHIPSLTVEEN